MHPGMHTPCSGWPQCFKFEKIGEMVVVDGLILTYASGVLESVPTGNEER